MESGTKPMSEVCILLVEDEEAVLGLLATLISKRYPDFELHSANNGRAGLELFQEHAPDIVITDIMMPEMSGTQMVESIREISCGAKIIVITAGTGKPPQEHAAGPEIDHYILKPINFQVLCLAIEECLGDLKREK